MYLNVCHCIAQVTLQFPGIGAVTFLKIGQSVSPFFVSQTFLLIQNDFENEIDCGSAGKVGAFFSSASSCTEPIIVMKLIWFLLN